MIIKKSLLLTILKILFATGLIVWLVLSGKLEFSDLGALLSPPSLLACLFLIGLGLVITTERWRALLRSQQVILTPLRAGQLVLIGTFFNYVMPGGVGGDVIKAFYIARDFPNSKTKVVISVLMDRIVGLFSMLLVALGILSWQWTSISETPQLRFIFTVLLFILGAFIAFWSVIFSGSIEKVILRIVSFIPGKKSIEKIALSLTAYRHQKKYVLISLALSLVAQMSSVLFFYVAGNALGFPNVPFSTYLFVVPVGFMIQAIPVAPAGIGIGQAAFLFLFNLAMNEKTSLGPSSITAFQLSTFFYGLIGAICYLNISRKMRSMEALDIKTTTGEM